MTSQVEQVEQTQKVFRTISEVANSLGVQQHVLRFWESKFSQICPMKRGGGRRYYRPEDVVIIEAVRKLLHEDGYTIKGAQKYLKEYGVEYVLNTTNIKARGHNKVPPLSALLLENSIVEESLVPNIGRLDDDMQMMTSLKKIRTRLQNTRNHLKSHKA